MRFKYKSTNIILHGSVVTYKIKLHMFQTLLSCTSKLIKRCMHVLILSQFVFR